MKGRVLVVDDDRSMCETLDVVLRQHDFAVSWTTDPGEIPALLESNDPDAVLTDLNMRGVSGLHLCERLAASRPDVPVIVITAFGSLETAIVAINCSAMPEALLESELFGHVRGAFTDALQPKLLRVLQERRVRPIGGNEEIPIDVRVVATTNRDLQTLIAAERFREDLFFRVNVIHVELPPLRARGGDVLLLAQRFLELYAARAGKRITAIAPADGDE